MDEPNRCVTDRDGCPNFPIDCKLRNPCLTRDREQCDRDRETISRVMRLLLSQLWLLICTGSHFKFCEVVNLWVWFLILLWRILVTLLCLLILEARINSFISPLLRDMHCMLYHAWVALHVAGRDFYPHMDTQYHTWDAHALWWTDAFLPWTCQTRKSMLSWERHSSSLIKLIWIMRVGVWITSMGIALEPHWCIRGDLLLIIAAISTVLREIILLETRSCCCQDELGALEMLSQDFAWQLHMELHAEFRKFITSYHIMRRAVPLITHTANAAMAS